MFKPLNPPPTYYVAFTENKTYVGDYEEICRFLKRNGLKPKDFKDIENQSFKFKSKNPLKASRITINIPSLKLSDLTYIGTTKVSKFSFDYQIVKFLRRKFKIPGATQKELLEVINLTEFQQKIFIASRK